MHAVPSREPQLRLKQLHAFTDTHTQAQILRQCDVAGLLSHLCIDTLDTMYGLAAHT